MGQVAGSLHQTTTNSQAARSWRRADSRMQPRLDGTAPRLRGRHGLKQGRPRRRGEKRRRFTPEPTTAHTATRGTAHSKRIHLKFVAGKKRREGEAGICRAGGGGGGDRALWPEPPPKKGFN